MFLFRCLLIRFCDFDSDNNLSSLRSCEYDADSSFSRSANLNERLELHNLIDFQTAIKISKTVTQFGIAQHIVMSSSSPLLFSHFYSFALTQKDFIGVSTDHNR